MSVVFTRNPAPDRAGPSKKPTNTPGGPTSLPAPQASRQEGASAACCGRVTPHSHGILYRVGCVQLKGRRRTQERANMDEIHERSGSATGDLCLLAYAQHMVETARSAPAKRLFESFAEQERRRLSANNAYHLHEIGAKDPTAANRTPRMPG